MLFFIRRLLLLMLSMLVMSVLIFLAVRILPGDMASLMAGVDAPKERVLQLRAQLGLNRPLIWQYYDWMTDLLHADFGTSMLTGRSVSSQIASRAAVTIPLIILALFMAVSIGVPLGCMTVLSPHARLRNALRTISIVGGSMPTLWGALLLILLLTRGSGLLGLFVSQGFAREGWSCFGAALSSLLLPALSVAITVSPRIMRYTRSALNETVASGYVLMAMSCGMTRRQAVLRVGLRLALPQLVSVVALTFAGMITGVVVVERLFALPGLGSGLVGDIARRDLVIAQSELMMLAMVCVTVGMVVDTVQHLLDPRLSEHGDGIGTV